MVTLWPDVSSSGGWAPTINPPTGTLGQHVCWDPGMATWNLMLFHRALQSPGGTQTSLGGPSGKGLVWQEEWGSWLQSHFYTDHHRRC